MLWLIVAAACRSQGEPAETDPPPFGGGGGYLCLVLEERSDECDDTSNPDCFEVACTCPAEGGGVCQAVSGRVRTTRRVLDVARAECGLVEREDCVDSEGDAAILSVHCAESVPEQCP